MSVRAWAAARLSEVREDTGRLRVSSPAAWRWGLWLEHRCATVPAWARCGAERGLALPLPVPANRCRACFDDQTGQGAAPVARDAFAARITARVPARGYVRSLNPGPVSQGGGLSAQARVFGLITRTSRATPVARAACPHITCK